MADVVDAIIVVGPVLWKCVNCNLLISRHHSIDQHLLEKHQSAASPQLRHTDSLKDTCNVPECCCRSLKKSKFKPLLVRKKHSKTLNKNNSKAAAMSFLNDIDRNNASSIDLEGSGCGDFENLTEVNGDESCDEEEDDDDCEVPQAFRDLVERASKDKTKGGATLPDGSLEEVDSVSNHLTESDSSPAALEINYFHSGQSVQSIEKSSDDIMCGIEADSFLTKVYPSDEGDSLRNASVAELKQLKRKQDSEENIGSCENIPNNKRAKADNYLEPSPEEQIINVNAIHQGEASRRDSVQGRRTSGRANKGKHSLYGDYRVEIT